MFGASLALSRLTYKSHRSIATGSKDSQGRRAIGSLACVLTQVECISSSLRRISSRCGPDATGRRGSRSLSERDRNSSAEKISHPMIRRRGFNELSALPLANLQLIIGVSTSKVSFGTSLVEQVTGFALQPTFWTFSSSFSSSSCIHSCPIGSSGDNMYHAKGGHLNLLAQLTEPSVVRAHPV